MKQTARPDQNAAATRGASTLRLLEEPPMTGGCIITVVDQGAMVRLLIMLTVPFPVGMGVRRRMWTLGPLEEAIPLAVAAMLPP